MSQISCLLMNQQRHRIKATQYYFNIVQDLNRAIKLLKAASQYGQNKRAKAFYKDVIKECQKGIHICFSSMVTTYTYFDSMGVFKKLL